ILAVGNDETLERDAARVADAEREGFDRMADRPPHLHDGEAALEQLVGLVRQQVAHALWPRPFGVVVVRTAHDLADPLALAQLVVRAPQGMLNHHHAPPTAL